MIKDKRFFCTAKMVTFILVLILFSIETRFNKIYASELTTIDDYDLSNIEDVIEESEYEEFSFKEMVELLISGESDTVLVDTVSYLFNSLISDLVLEKDYILNIVFISICSAFLSGFAKVFERKGVSDTGFFICYIAVMTIGMSIFLVAYDIACEVITLVLEFMNALIPCFFLSVGMIGQTSAVGFYQVIIVIIYFVENFLITVLMPATKVYLVMMFVNNVAKEDYMSKAIKLLKKGLLMGNKWALRIILAFNVIQGMILPHVDGLKTTTIKKLAGAIPIVGGGTGAATDIFLGSSILIKNSLGTAAIVVLLVISAIPILKLIIINIALQMSAALIQPVSDKRITDCISNLGEAIGIVGKMACTVTLLFIVTVGLICVMTNIN